MIWGKGKFLFNIALAIIFACWLFLFSSKTEAADPSGLLINEIYPVPETGGKEWVEIYNPTDEGIDLSDFSLKDGSIAAKNLSGIILAGEYFIFETTSGWLNNLGETISLIRRSDLKTIDQVSYGDWNDNQENQPLAPPIGKTLNRIPNGTDSGCDLEDFKILSPSKNLKNVLPVYSNQIIINEIVPQPSTSSKDEFVELFNSGSSDVDLSGWQIDDAENSGSTIFSIPNGTVINSLAYLSFYNSDTGILFNDSGDTVRLIDPNYEEKSKIVYISTKRGQSYSLFSDWQWTTSITSGAINVLVLETEEASAEIQIVETDIAGARDMNDEIIVSVTGTVTALPGKLSSQYFYIQDKNSGIQIYNNKKEFPALALGDEVKIIGELDTISNERRIKIASANDIIILSSHPPPEPKIIVIEDLDEGFEGEYVEFVGTVSKTSGSTFYVHGSGEIQVVIRSGTGIKKPRMKVGDKVAIAGILSQYNDNYRILPIRQSDVKIISSSKLADTGPSLLISLISAFCFTIIYGIYKQKSSRYGKFCNQIYPR